MRVQIHQDIERGFTAWLNSDFPLANGGKPFLEIEDSAGHSNFYRPDDVVEENISDQSYKTAANVQARLLENLPNAATILAKVTEHGVLNNAALQYEPTGQNEASGSPIYTSAKIKVFAVQNGIQIHSDTGEIKTYGDSDILPSGTSVSLWKSYLRPSAPEE